MGWKNVKKHYRIDHFVCVTDKGICIGSGYIHDIIVLNPWKKTITETMGPSNNDKLARYLQEMRADQDKLWALIEEKDTFEVSLPVWTYKGGDIVELACEKREWPNVTHDGQMMYENLFFATRAQAISAGIRESEAAVKHEVRATNQREKELADGRMRLAEYQADLAKLRHAQLTEIEISGVPEREAHIPLADILDLARCLQFEKTSEGDGISLQQGEKAETILRKLIQEHLDGKWTDKGQQE